MLVSQLPDHEEGGRQRVFTQVGKPLPSLSSFWALIRGPARQELLRPAVPIWGESP